MTGEATAARIARDRMAVGVVGAGVLLLFVASALLLASSAFVPPFLAEHWRTQFDYRGTGSAERAAARVLGEPVDKAVAILGEPDWRAGTVISYRLSDTCGTLLTIDPCDLVLFVSGGRVVGAELQDTGALPGDPDGARCLAGAC